jgi:hypothetical protein
MQENGAGWSFERAADTRRAASGSSKLGAWLTSAVMM